MRAMRLVGAFIILFVTLFASTEANAQSEQSFGWAISDVTYESSCSLTYRTLTSADPGAEVLDEVNVECPPGSVLHMIPATEEEAIQAGALFVPRTGNDDADAWALESTKASLRADAWSYAAAQNESARGCNDASFSASLGYYAYNPGVSIYVTVYYAQDYTCAAWISSAAASTDWNADIWWRQAGYSNPVSYRTHGCTNLSPSGYWHAFSGWSVNGFGGWYYDESENENYLGCIGWGESYSGGIYL